MSFTAIDPVAAGGIGAAGAVPAADPTAAAPIGPQAATARIAELQQLIAQAGCGPASSNGGASFADALAGAGGKPTASAAGAFGAAGAYGTSGAYGTAGATGGYGTASAFGTAGATGAFGTAGAYGTAGALGATGVGTNAAPGTDGAGGTGAAPYDDLVTAAAQRNGIDPALLHGLIQQESGFDPTATSGAGAQGLCQLMPGTAASLGVSNPLDPAQSIEGGARYLKQQLAAFGGDPQLALAAYNAGPGAVRRYGGVPPYAETQAYVQKVMGYANAYRSSHPTLGAAAAPPTPTTVLS